VSRIWQLRTSGQTIRSLITTRAAGRMTHLTGTRHLEGPCESEYAAATGFSSTDGVRVFCPNGGHLLRLTPVHVESGTPCA
jgi:hypothetical protein